MSKFLFIILLSIILESTFVPFPVTLMAVMLTFIFSEADEAVVAFGAGLILDILSLRIWGADSLYFLSILYIAGRYRKKIYEGTFVWRFLFFSFSFVIYNLFFYRTFNIIITVTALISTGILLLWLDKASPIKKRGRLVV